MDHGPGGKGGDAADPGGTGPDSGPDNQAAADHDVTGGEPAREADAEMAGKASCETHEEATAAESKGELGEGASAKKPAQSRYERWRKPFWAGVGAVVVAVIAGLVTNYLTSYVSPPATAPVPPIGNPGHPPGRQDVSTMKPGQRFYAVPNFYDFQSCGRPCWLPLYQLPTQQSERVTQNWPCEYYDPTSVASGDACLQPPSGRTSGEMADAAMKNSGDRVFVLCQVRPAQNIHNGVGQSSDVWDMVAVPASHVFQNNAADTPLTPVPGMPGFYEAFGPDIWLGNTSWHRIPCK
jgi:hypothetical protein